MTRALLGALLAITGCAADDSHRCDIGAQSAAVQAADRKIIGAAANYSADGMLRGREDDLRRSQKLRREVAWKTAEKVLAPVALNVPLPLAPAAEIPAWQTWYGRDDLSRLFQHLYDDLGPEGRNARRRFAEESLDDALGWNLRAVEDLDNWPTERWQAYLDSIDEPDEVSGLGGIAPVVYSPSAATHMLSSYSDVLSCMENGAPDAFVDGPGEDAQQALREPIVLAGCRERLFGPFFVATGESLQASLDGDDTAGAVLEIRGVAAASPSECQVDAGVQCVVERAGGYYVSVRSGDEGLRGTVTVDYTQPKADWAACLRSAFPLDAAVVKASWHRAQHGFELPTFDTSAARLSHVVKNDADWGETGDAQADPGPESIYTMKLENGNVYRLAGLHIMTKELDHWVWITLWWSPDPNTDFGADRPTTLSGPWKNYKMCVTTSFDELDPDPSGGFAATAPSLGNALAAVHPGVGGPSWCSNPYLELGKGNAATNCIGCHQHAGTLLSAETIIGDQDAFPAHGRTLLRNNFPADYSFAIDAGDRIGPMFRDVVRYYESFD